MQQILATILLTTLVKLEVASIAEKVGGGRGSRFPSNQCLGSTGLGGAEACLANHDLKLTADHLKVAKWNIGEVTKAIQAVGQSKNQR